MNIIIFAVVVVFLILIALYIYKTRKTKRNVVLLLGLSDSGKTAIFLRLLFKYSFVPTVTSLKENIAEYDVGKSVLQIIDIPGHERLRGRYFDQYKTLTRGLIFVVDSVNIQRDIKDVAEFLYSCLTDNFIYNNSVPLLILCNKQSEATAKGSTIIKMLLEKEINILRLTKANQLESIGKTSSNIFLGNEKKDFDFSDLHPMKIDFAECSGIIDQNKDLYNVEEVEKWLEGLA